MKYAKEVIELLEPYPGRHFRMGDIVRYVAPHATGHERQRVRKGVLRVLESLVDSGHVRIEPAVRRGGFATYAWKVGHGVSQKWDRKCDNKACRVAP